MSDRVVVKSKSNGLEVTVDGVSQIDNFKGRLILHTDSGKKTFDEGNVDIVRIDKNYSPRVNEALNESQREVSI